MHNIEVVTPPESLSNGAEIFNKLVFPFVVRISLSDIPDQKCDVCKTKNRKVYQVFRQPFSLGKDSHCEALCCRVPGYHCDDCGKESYDPESSLLALLAVEKIVKKAGDRETLELVQASIAVAQHHMIIFDLQPQSMNGA